MPRRLLYALGDALRAAHYTEMPDPAEVARAIEAGMIPWIDRDATGRLGFDEGNIEKIAGALGLKKPAPVASGARPGIAGISAKFDALFK
jgi:hypothetical protein